MQQHPGRSVSREPRDVNRGVNVPESKNRRTVIALGGALLLLAGGCVCLGLIAASRLKLIPRQATLPPFPTATLSPQYTFTPFAPEPDEQELHFFQTPIPIPGTIDVPGFKDGVVPPAIIDPLNLPPLAEVMEPLPFTAAEADAAWNEFQSSYPAWKQKYLVPGENNLLTVKRSGDDALYPADMGKALMFAAFNQDKATFDQLMATVNNSVDSFGFMHGNQPDLTANTRAQEDIAFALTEAARLWGGDYTVKAREHIVNIRMHMIGPLYEMLPGPGAGGSADLANPAVRLSDITPRYYERFARFDPEGAEDWELTTLAGQKIMDINFARNPGYRVLPNRSTIHGDLFRGAGSDPETTYASDESRDIPALLAMQAMSGNIPSDVLHARRILARYNQFYTAAGVNGIYNRTLPDGSQAPGDYFHNGVALAGALPSSIMSGDANFRSELMRLTLQTADNTFADDTAQLFSLLAMSGRTGD